MFRALLSSVIGEYCAESSFVQRGARVYHRFGRSQAAPASWLFVSQKRSACCSFEQARGDELRAAAEIMGAQTSGGAHEIPTVTLATVATEHHRGAASHLLSSHAVAEDEGAETESLWPCPRKSLSSRSTGRMYATLSCIILNRLFLSSPGQRPRHLPADSSLSSQPQLLVDARLKPRLVSSSLRRRLRWSPVDSRQSLQPHSHL